MDLLPLSEVRAQLREGSPLPWNVRDASGKLLLAQGHLVTSAAMVQALLSRGVFVAQHEASGAGVAAPPAAEPGSPFERWARLCDNLADVLRSPQQRQFLSRIREAASHVMALNELNADLLLFLILRHDHGDFESYGVAHSLHVACVCSLLSQRLDWSRDDQQRAIGAALTMNLSTIELQGQCARQSTPLTRRQRELSQAHPAEASMMLRAAGLDDLDWLAAVEDHHERLGGAGYPSGRTDPGALSQMLRLTDQFTAKHSARATRPALPALRAARELFLENPGDAMAQRLIKEFGIYPPGCQVRLSSGELAIVVRRGASAQAPEVAVIATARGEPLGAPLRRDTSATDCSIVECLPEATSGPAWPAHALYPEALAA